MSNLLDRFQKHIVGSDGKFADYTSIISPKGDFKRISDLEVILNSWKNILIGFFCFVLARNRISQWRF